VNHWWSFYDTGDSNSVEWEGEQGKEIFEEKIYERFFCVDEGDIVFDAGSSIGIFGYSILDKKPSRIYCIEPSSDEFETLKLNIPVEIGVFLNQGISKIDGEIELTEVYENNKEVSSKLFKVSRFKTILDQYNIKKIDFLKTDCEGCEYDIFDIDNLIWLKQNVSKIAGEWHLSDSNQKNKFREFRDVFLRVFPKHEIFSVDGVDIKWDLWNEHFIEYYKQVIIYIDNRT
jgi:FkbM family methyltransferase